MNYEYLILLIVIFLITLFLEFKFRVKLYSSRKERIIIPILFFVVGVILDSFAIWRGYWNFGELMGITIGFMPLEEYLFMIIFPYFIITLYRVLKKEI